MFADEIRRAAEAAARVELPVISAVLWKAFGAGQVTEAEAEALSALIEARKAVPVVAKAPLRRVGSRPRTDASLERRRRWAASGRLPLALAAQFTQAEVAVLAVIAVETIKRGDCRLCLGHIAALAGVGETSVRRALRAARDLGLITVEERRLSRYRNDSNVVRIVSAEWTSWLRLARHGGGRQTALGTSTSSSRPSAKSTRKPQEKAAGRQGRLQGRGLRESQRTAEAAGTMG